jgi:hypothetical protein
MTSQINPNNINGNYPVAGVPNNTQGFRDNFTNTRTNFEFAADEISELQTKAVLKAGLGNSLPDNNMADNLIYAAKIQDFSGTVVQLAATSGTIEIDYSAGHYQTINTTGSVSLAFVNFPVSGSVGMLRIRITVNSTAHTLTLPAAVALGVTGIQGYSAGVITFAATGTFEFGFLTSDGGTNITIFDLNRPLSRYTNPITVLATTAATSTTTGAVTVAGGVGIQGNLWVGGSIAGNIQLGNVTTTGSITATGGFIGNLTGNMAGTLIGAVNGIVDGDLSGSVFADDSTLLVDGVMGRIVAPVFADVTGNVSGNLSGSVYGNSSTLIVDAQTNKVFATVTYLTGKEDLADTAAANLNVTASYFTTGGAETATLAAGTEGQIKTFMGADLAGGNMVITVTNPGWSASATGTMTFAVRGDACTLQYVNGKWYCIGNNGVVFG